MTRRTTKKNAENAAQLRLSFDGRSQAVAANGGQQVSFSVDLPVGTSLSIRLDRPAPAPNVPANDEPDPDSGTRARAPAKPTAPISGEHMLTPPYPARGTPAYDALRVKLREDFKNAFRRLSGAAKTFGAEQPLQFSVFNREGMQGFYGDRDTRGLANRKGIPMRKYWDRADVAELSYNIERMDRARNALNALPESERTVQKALQVHRDIGYQLRRDFERAHKRDGVPVHPANIRPGEPLSAVRKRIRDRAREARNAEKAAAKAAKKKEPKSGPRAAVPQQP